MCHNKVEFYVKKTFKMQSWYIAGSFFEILWKNLCDIYLGLFAISLNITFYL